MTYGIICKVMVALAYDSMGGTEMELYGKLVKETETHYVGDFSEDLKRLPIIGDTKNYSAVELPKARCQKYREE